MTSRRGSLAGWMIAVGALALLVPVVLALIVFPTPMDDTREVFAWGRFFPVATHKHPPMMALVAGLTETVLPATAFSAIAVGQAINAVAIAYLYGSLNLVVDGYRARLFTFLFAASIYFMVAPIVYALNADILQVPIWLAIVYHFVRAARTNAPLQWGALALWAAAAMMTKYAVALLFLSGGAAVLLTPEFRAVLRNPRFYLAILLGLVALVPHLLAFRANSSAMAYTENFAFGRVTPWASAIGFAEDYAFGSSRLWTLMDFTRGVAMAMAPGWIVIAIGFVIGRFTLDRAPVTTDTASARRFFAVIAMALIVLTVFLAVGLGSTFDIRFSTPMLGLFVLGAAPRIAPRPDARAAVGRDSVVVASIFAGTILAGASILYGVYFSHDRLQEPTAEAAASVRAAWEERFTCGPGYFLGDRASAHGFAIVGDRYPIGMPLGDIPLASWFDPARLAAEGAIVVFRGAVREAEMARFLPGAVRTEVANLTVPLLRTASGATITYQYFFIPPGSCSADASSASPGKATLTQRGVEDVARAGKGALVKRQSAG